MNKNRPRSVLNQIQYINSVLGNLQLISPFQNIWKKTLCHFPTTNKEKKVMLFLFVLALHAITLIKNNKKCRNVS